MAKSHGARQQKKVAKQKAKRSDKRSDLIRRSSNDPTVRLQRAEKWPVVHALVGENLWEDGIGYLVIARQESEGRLIFASYLVDVYCLGVKDAFWDAGTNGEFRELIRKMGTTQTMLPISPACLVKIVKGAVDYALSFGFRPHPDFRHAAMLLEGIDPSTCLEEFTFGRDGKPFYFQGPNESPEQARAILERIHAAGGHFIVQVPDPGSAGFVGLDVDDLDVDDDEDEPLE
jgi:hypothetical protein